jgi:electron transfer flavoprotein alpha subunit
MSTALVFVEHQQGSVKRASLEAIGAARAVGLVVTAIATGPGARKAAESAGRYGAARAIVVTGADAYSPDGTAADAAGAIQREGAGAFFAAATACGRDLLPRVAARLDCAPIADCTFLRAEAGRLIAVRPMLAGKVIATVQSKSAVFCASLRPNCFAATDVGGSAQIVEVAAAPSRKVIVASVAAKTDAKLDVKEAPIVVAGGRGLKGPENFKLIEELAAAFGNAAVGASRAVVDAGWRPHAEQVGQTGKTVQSQLYVAIGISGAIQHLAGMRTSKVIVAINKDPAAPIFKVADYGIVGDALEVLPVLTDAVKEARASR